MKTTHGIFATLTICALALAGCSKESGDAPGPIPVYYGVKMDALPKLDTEFKTAAPDVQNGVNAAKRALRYQLYPQTLAELGKLAKNPSLTEPQKKAVTDLLEQVKQVVAASKPTP
jgi:hypothetical protein